MGPKPTRAGIGKKTVGFKNEVTSTAGSNALGKEALSDMEQKAGPFPGRDFRGKQGPKAKNSPQYQGKVVKKGSEGNSENAGHLPSHNWEAAIHPQFLLSGLSGEAPHEEPGTGGSSLPLGKTGTGTLRVDSCKIRTQGLPAHMWILGLALTQEGQPQHHCLCPHLAMLATLDSCLTDISEGVGRGLHVYHKAPSEANSK